MVGLTLLGISIFLFINTREMINAYFSTAKLKFLIKYIESSYLYDVDEEVGLKGIYGGYLEGLDNRITYYLETDDLKAAKIQYQGEYFGTGIKFKWSIDGHSFTIVEVLKGSMAEEQGLKVGDIITQINEVSVLPENRQQLIEKITSNREEVTQYVIKRDDISWKIELMPTKVVVEDLTSEMLNQVLYIKLNTVKKATSLRMKEILDTTDFTECKGLILDVRNLMTYQMEEVAKISDLFLDGGIAFKVSSKIDGVIGFEMSKGAYEMPMVIIMNSETLGGTEALVLALKERATLLGSNTGGLRYVQKIINFEDTTGMSVASGKICDRYGEELDEEGISPSIRIYLNEEDILTRLAHGYLIKEEDHYLQDALALF